MANRNHGLDLRNDYYDSSVRPSRIQKYQALKGDDPSKRFQWRRSFKKIFPAVLYFLLRLSNRDFFEIRDKTLF
jgi:hypothetical protein